MSIEDALMRTAVAGLTALALLVVASLWSGQLGCMGATAGSRTSGPGVLYMTHDLRWDAGMGRWYADPCISDTIATDCCPEGWVAVGLRDAELVCVVE